MFHLKTNVQVSARLLSRIEFRGLVSTCTEMTETSWEEFFKDPSQYYDLRNNKKNHELPDFRHKRTGKGLWVHGVYTPPWVPVKLTSIELPQLEEVNGERAAIIELIKVSGRRKDISKMRRILEDKPWISEDITIANTLIRSYAKCGAVKEAQRVFDQLAERTVVSWSALITGYAEQGFGEQALSCYQQMESDGMTPDAVTYASTLKACAIVGANEMVKKIHACLRDHGLLNKDTVLGNSLVNAYAKCGAVKEAQEVFDQIPHRDVVSWSALIAGYAEHGFGQEALKCFKEMESDGVTPNSLTYTSTLKACGITGELEIVKGIHNQIRDQDLLNKHIALGNSLVNAYAKCGAVEEAHEMFNQLLERDVVTWSALIAGYAEQGFSREALSCFRKMENHGLTPDSVSYASTLKACACAGDIDTVKGIHSHVREQGLLDKDVILGNSLVNAYAKCGNVKQAHYILDQLVQRDVASWNALMVGYSEMGFDEEALNCFREMEYDGVSPNSLTYAFSLKSCATVGALDTVKEIHAQVREQELLCTHSVLGNSLVNAYAKCSAMKEAQQLFDQLSMRDVVSWTAVLTGYAQLGYISEMLQLLDRMVSEGVFPDAITFLELLNRCSHGALLEEGERLFCLIGTYGLVPTPEHYTCMVDMFGRAGLLNQAKYFVLDYTPALLAFLGACQKSVDVDLAKWAFSKLLQLDQRCTSGYVSMANIYAAAGMVKQVEEIEFLCEARSYRMQLLD